MIPDNDSAIVKIGEDTYGSGLLVLDYWDDDEKCFVSGGQTTPFWDAKKAWLSPDFYLYYYDTYLAFTVFLSNTKKLVKFTPTIVSYCYDRQDNYHPGDIYHIDDEYRLEQVDPYPAPRTPVRLTSPKKENRTIWGFNRDGTLGVVSINHTGYYSALLDDWPYIWVGGQDVQKGLLRQVNFLQLIGCNEHPRDGFNVEYTHWGMFTPIALGTFDSSVSFDPGTVYAMALDSTQANIYMGTGGAIKKYNSSGSLQWSKNFREDEHNENCICYAVAIDSSGDIYAGTSPWRDQDVADASSAWEDAYSYTAGDYTYTPADGGTANEYVYKAKQNHTSDGDNGWYEYDSGWYQGPDFDDYWELVYLYYNVHKYNASGTLQQRYQFAYSTGLYRYTTAYKLRIDSAGKFVMVLYYDHRLGIHKTHLQKSDLSAIDWTYQCSLHEKTVSDIKLDSSDNIYVGGSEVGASGVYLRKLNSSGASQWTFTTAAIIGLGIDADDSNRIYAAGNTVLYKLDNSDGSTDWSKAGIGVYTGGTVECKDGLILVVSASNQADWSI